MAECLLRCSWVVHPTHGLRAGETLPMRKPATGEPCAGEPHARFGGRGGPTPFPTPIGSVRTSVTASNCRIVTFVSSCLCGESLLHPPTCPAARRPRRGRARPG